MLILLIITALALMASLLADRSKTLSGLKKGYKMFLGILPMLLNVLILVSIVLYLVPKETLVKWLGANSGLAGYAIAAAVGSIALIPGFVAFPLAALLLKSGVGYAVTAVFITTLMMVGILTLPLEIKYFGRKVALMRNALSLAGALLVGLLIRIFM
ncbi:MAG: hypothetical protein A2509_00785 [Candidatus Edwardsbacteria bacterium RIFOXYD12_FULL_50_11]|uniref:Permease n=1 Tax=Candidatus Edwardsbacteria bacterium GWF2_54_11 TaxID=1817851 RepID=A0A1F5RC93_9BACT|nr:MAG: hypothetical protein A2502_07690 [Candidatus Edwardsbacteria bacterium RifOxyC12_full_54_24]OGF07521.1 MAG: hypothetical protein A2273_03370 [Candidatus Edwardsbacteria bacterium RifOxyA12_full_54_48]OGF09771.1 MAG: hypothetical protein A3K15_09780 [Candidatus Edwardsbacteria bacterium GWE2_54_12]OGF12034.1 MAG: hypothetical protein A2024_03335 [Candidatus Edwardsbacteria bacterium GWF2_54_11]OGF16132.1 MAG: hypothetical protein A2509_00785 [Candidatus Edwardsbacteria bacterium RIFOXYD1